MPQACTKLASRLHHSPRMPFVHQKDLHAPGSSRAAFGRAAKHPFRRPSRWLRLTTAVSGRQCHQLVAMHNVRPRCGN